MSILRKPCFALLSPLLLTVLLWSTGQLCFAQTETLTRQLAPGILYTQEITKGNTPLVINVLKIDLSAPGVRVRTGQAQDVIGMKGATQGRETINTLAARNGAIAAVNADFFPFNGDPVGLAIRDGELLSEPRENRACLGLSGKAIAMGVFVAVGTLTPSNGTPLSLDGINRVPHENDLLILTPTYTGTPSLEKPGVVVLIKEVNLPVRLSQEMKGTIESITLLAKGQKLPVCPPGYAQMVGVGTAVETVVASCRQEDAVTFRFDLTANEIEPSRGRFPSRAAVRGRVSKRFWTDVEQAVGGGPWLVRDGRITIDGEAEGFPKAEFVEKAHPRTAAGATSDGKLLLVTVDGRQWFSRGATLSDMAEILIRYGAINAINLDGGGSTGMVVGNGVVNAPSDGRLRPIANSLLVYGTPDTVAEAETYRISQNAPDRLHLTAGESLQITLNDASNQPLPANVPVFWGTGDGLGFLTQRGLFTCQKAGTGTIIARVGGRLLTMPITVESGPAARIVAKLSSVPDNPPDLSLLTLTVTDRFGNTVAGQKVTVTVGGGAPVPVLVTDSQGTVLVEVNWDVEPGKRKLTLTAGNASVTLMK